MITHYLGVIHRSGNHLLVSGRTSLADMMLGCLKCQVMFAGYQLPRPLACSGRGGSFLRMVDDDVRFDPKAHRSKISRASRLCRWASLPRVTRLLMPDLTLPARISGDGQR